MQRAHDLVDEAVDAAGDAEREPVARCSDAREQLRQIGAFVADDVQDRPEHFPVGEVILVDFVGDRGEVMAARQIVGTWHGTDALRARGEPVPIILERRERLSVDERSDVGFRSRRVAQSQKLHRA